TTAAQAAAAATAEATQQTDPVPQPTPPPAPVAPVQPQVTITSSPPNSVVGEYKIDFDTLDANHDGNLSRAEARSNATLTAEFRAVDVDNNGRLSKKELSGWMR
ncbi:hypothetical protein, partial [Lysobacter sp. 1R34A]|uniref:hypothetical protein n=1 Tax=Lysobacter sp. 1R34A TaxID=3445786 RepID=UPI003EEB787E